MRTSECAFLPARPSRFYDAPVRTSAEPGTGLYVHLPFCARRCTYCAFAISTDTALEDAYTRALNNEIVLRSPDWGRSLRTLYLGGGTPSRSSRGSLERIFTTIRNQFDTGSIREVTIEANPEDVSEEAIRFWTSLGIDRVSLGVQSFHDRELQPLGRLHGRAGALDAIRVVSSAGVRLSIDLIAGLPDQTPDSFAESIELLLQAEPDHASIYLLDLEPGSALETMVSSRRVDIPPDSEVAECYRLAVSRLDEAGLRQYEISNFSREETRAVHNTSYWEGLPYLGVGLSAHSFDGRARYANSRNMRRYIELASASGSAVESRDEIDENARRRERLLLSLRRIEGLEDEEFEALTGEKGSEWLDRGRENGWVRTDRIALTVEGFLLSNELIGELF